MEKEYNDNTYNNEHDISSDYEEKLNQYIFIEDEELTKENNIKMNYWYNLISKIPDYINNEKKMYLKVDADSKLEKIFFEIKRIYNYAINNYLDEEKTLSINYLLKYYRFIINFDSTKKEKLEEYCNHIIKLIIKLEIEFNMKIGLYEEFIKYYKEYNINYGKKKELNKSLKNE